MIRVISAFLLVRLVCVMVVCRRGSTLMLGPTLGKARHELLHASGVNWPHSLPQTPYSIPV